MAAIIKLILIIIVFYTAYYLIFKRSKNKEREQLENFQRRRKSRIIEAEYETVKEEEQKPEENKN